MNKALKDIVKALVFLFNAWTIIGYITIAIVVVTIILTDYKPTDWYTVILSIIAILAGANMHLEKKIRKKSIGRCPSCGKQLCWNSDFDAQDVGHEDEGIVTYYQCSNCEVTVEQYIKI